MVEIVIWIDTGRFNWIKPRKTSTCPFTCLLFYLFIFLCAQGSGTSRKPKLCSSIGSKSKHSGFSFATRNPLNQPIIH